MRTSRDIIPMTPAITIIANDSFIDYSINTWDYKFSHSAVSHELEQLNYFVSKKTCHFRLRTNLAHCKLSFDTL